MNLQSSDLPFQQEEDIDAEADLQKLNRWVNIHEHFIKKICEKLGVKYYGGYKKGKEMRELILQKINELVSHPDKDLLRKIENVLNKHESQMSDEQKDDAIRQLTLENNNGKRDIEKLEKTIEDLNKNIELYSQSAGGFLLQNSQIFSADFTTNLIQNIEANKKGSKLGLQKVIIDHVNKKVIIEYDFTGNIAVPSAESLAEQEIAQERQEKFINTLSLVMKQILDQNQLLLRFVTEFKDYIHFEDNCEEEHIKQEKEEIQRKEESLTNLYEELSKQKKLSELVAVLDAFCDNEINNWNATYESLTAIYHRFLNKTREMTTQYETMVTSYLVGEDNIQI